MYIQSIYFVLDVYISVHDMRQTQIFTVIWIMDFYHH